MLVNQQPGHKPLAPFSITHRFYLTFIQPIPAKMPLKNLLSHNEDCVLFHGTSY